MKIRGVAVELCWCAATALCMGAFVVVLTSVDLTGDLDLSAVRIALLLVSAGAFAVMVALMVLAFGLERSGGRVPPGPDSTKKPMSSPPG